MGIKTFFVMSTLFLSLFLRVPPVFADAEREYDIVIAGAGSGGVSAAIQAARMGMSVALLEPSDWIGGQMTGAAVSTMDDKTLTRTGIYGEFISRVRDYYAALGRNVNICYWGNDTISFEPAAGRKILLQMLEEAGEIDLTLRAKPLSVLKKDDRITSAVFEVEGEPVLFTAGIFIDATEYGDFLPLTGARYRSGNSLSPNIRQGSVIQDITYTAVVKKYKDGLPPELRMTSPPPKYYDYLFYFRSLIRPGGNTWPGSYPFNTASHNAYRALPDPEGSALVLGGESDTWRYITKTVVNWANDYPGGGYPDFFQKNISLSAEYLENHNYRVHAEREAMLKTLCFIYYMQRELGMSDWSVDDGQGYGSWFSNDWPGWRDILEPYAPILSYFPPFPYVRESRRLVGIKTMTIEDIKRQPELKRTPVNVCDSVALGEYPTDIHGRNEDEYLEADLGETRDKLPDDWQGDGGLFQIPLGVFIPEKIDGLLAAEKNISVSRVVNGSTRLQPVTMLTGQAAGTIAALAVKKRVQPRALSVFDVQAELLRSKTRLSLYIFKDAPEHSPFWPGIEAAVLYEYMWPVSDTCFGAYEEIHWIDVRDVFRAVLKIKTFPPRNGFDKVPEKDFAQWLAELYGEKVDKYKSITDKLTSDRYLSKGHLAQIIFEIWEKEKTEA